MHIRYVTLHDLTQQAAYGPQIVQMCRTFGRLGNDVELFSAGGQDSSSPKRLKQFRNLYGEDIPFSVHFFPSRTILGRLKMLGGLRGAVQAVRGMKTDLVYCRGHWEALSLARLDAPVIFEAHATKLHDEFPILDRLLRRRTVRASRLPNLRLFVCISQALAKVWHEFGVPEEKIYVAHDAVDVSMFEPALTIEEARARLGLQENRPVILYAGSLYQDRGLELLLGAAKALPEYSFWILGGSEQDMARSKRAAKEAGVTNVQFLGFVAHPRVPVYLFAADVLLMLWTWRVPTIATCSPMKMFEYMAAQRTIVGPAFPTVLEVFEKDKDAILFEPDNLQDMIQALRRGVEESHRGNLAATARRKVIAKYTWELRCRGILEAFAARNPGEAVPASVGTGL
jgi:glycosyltransferase involved in cell wall biosynthesis